MPHQSRSSGTGRTTGLMLRAMGDALLRPNRWVRFEDHAAPCARCDLANKLDTHAQCMRIMARELGITLEIRVHRRRMIRVRSPIARMPPPPDILPFQPRRIKVAKGRGGC